MSGLTENDAYMSEIMSAASSVSDMHARRAIELILLLIQDVKLSAVSKVEVEVGAVAQRVEALSDAVARSPKIAAIAPALPDSNPQTGTLDSLPSLPSSSRSSSVCSDCSDVAALQDVCHQAWSSQSNHAADNGQQEGLSPARAAQSSPRALLSAKARAQTLDSLPAMRGNPPPQVSGHLPSGGPTKCSDATQLGARRVFNCGVPCAPPASGAPGRAGKNSSPSSSGKLLLSSGYAQTMQSLPNMAPRRAAGIPKECTPSSCGALVSADSHASTARPSPASSCMLRSAQSSGKVMTFDSLPLCEVPSLGPQLSKPSADDVSDLPMWLRGVPPAKGVIDIAR